MTVSPGQLVVRVEPDFRKKGVARVKSIQQSAAGQAVVVETYLDGRWVESGATGVPPDSYQPANPLDIANARTQGKLPEAKGAYPISDLQLSLALAKPPNHR